MQIANCEEKKKNEHWQQLYSTGLFLEALDKHWQLRNIMNFVFAGARFYTALDSAMQRSEMLEQELARLVIFPFLQRCIIYILTDWYKRSWFFFPVCFVNKRLAYISVEEPDHMNPQYFSSRWSGSVKICQNININQIIE